MGYNEIARYISENPGTAFTIGGGTMLTLVLMGKSALHKLLKPKGRTYKQYPDIDNDDRRMGDKMPYYGNDKDFHTMESELREQRNLNT